MGYDISYHPLDAKDVEKYYFDQLEKEEIDAELLSLLNENEQTRYKELIDIGKKNTDSVFETSHGYFASVALGYFQKFYYIRGTGISFLLKNYPNYQTYLHYWNHLLPNRDFKQEIENKIIANYSSGVLISPSGVVKLLEDYKENPIIKLELDFYFDADIHQFLAALNDAKSQGKGLLEATEVFSPFEGNFASDKQLIAKNSTPFDRYDELKLEKEYYTLFDEYDNISTDEEFEIYIEKVHSLLSTYPYPAKIYFALGSVYSWESNNKCEEYFQKALENGFDSFIIEHYLGEYYKVIGADEAEKTYLKSLEKNPNNELNWVGIGDIAEAQKRWKDAKDAYENAIKINPYSNAYQNNLGVYYANLEENQKALECYKKARILKPSDYNATKNLAWHLHKMGEKQEAKIVSLLALIKFENHGTFLFLLGRIFLGEKDYIQAEKYLQESISKYPTYMSSYHELVNVYKAQGENDKANELLKKTNTINPEDAFTFYQMGIKEKNSGNYQNAIEHFKKALSLGDDVVDNNHKIGFCYEKLNQINDALKHFLIAYELEKNDASLCYNIGCIYYEKKELENAVEWMDKALFINENYLNAIYNKGIYLYVLNKDNDALNVLLSLENKHPNYQKTHLYLGHITYLLKEYELAKKYYESHLKKEPNHYESNFNVGYILHIQKEYGKALEYYEIALDVSKKDATLLYSRP